MSRSISSRRDFLKASGLALAPGALSSCGRAAPRPNILWITCEDISPLLGCYGDSYAYTPNLDRLAAEGVRYTNAFSTASVCTPSRSCLITGVHATSLGTQNLRAETPLAADIHCYTEFLRKAGYYCTNNVKEDYNFHTPAAAWDESSKKAHWRNRPPDRPFFSIFNLTMTHQGQVRYGREKLEQVSAQLAPEERHDPAKAPLPPYYPDTPAVRANIAALYTQMTLMDKKAGELLGQLAADGLAGDTIVFFYSDHGPGLPRGKRWIHRSGIQVPLLIRFPEKFRHLAPAPPGSVVDRLVSFVDFPPTMLSLTGLPIPDYMQGRAFLGGQAGEPRRYIFAARDRVDEVLECSRTVCDSRYQYIRNYLPHRPRMQRSHYSEVTPIRKELRRLAAAGKLAGGAAWLMQPAKPPEELYDITRDPHEIRNLAGSPEHREILERMRKALRDWMIRTRDTGLLPEPELVRRAAGGSPYDMARQPGAFDVERILEAAELVGRGVKKLPELEALLEDKDSAVRYWAAAGLTALGAEARPAAGALRKALEDSSPCVRIAAAEALARIGREREALPVLSQCVLDQDSRVQLQAAIALVALGGKARPLKAVLQKALRIESKPQQHRRYVQWALEGLLEELEA